MESKSIEDFNLKALQSKELLILKEVKRICEKHNIEFFLNFGTLLGAVRHKGFIPWDDDIDLGMTYPNLVKFREVCKTELGIDFFLQNEETEPAAGLTFDKVRLNNTTLIAKNMANRNINHGIDVDIYPLYNVPNGRLQRKLQLFASALYMLFLVGDKPANGSKLLKILSAMLLFLVKGKIRNWLKNKCHGYMAKFENQECINKAFLCCNLRVCRRTHQSSWFRNYELTLFEDDNYSVPNGYASLLNSWYGDYMKLPPIEDRIAKLNNVLFVDTNNTYKKYRGIYYCN